MLVLSTSSLTFKQKLEYANYIVKDPINKEAFRKFKKICICCLEDGIFSIF